CVGQGRNPGAHKGVGGGVAGVWNSRERHCAGRGNDASLSAVAQFFPESRREDEEHHLQDSVREADDDAGRDRRDGSIPAIFESRRTHHGAAPVCGWRIRSPGSCVELTRVLRKRDWGKFMWDMNIMPEMRSLHYASLQPG